MCIGTEVNAQIFFKDQGLRKEKLAKRYVKSSVNVYCLLRKQI